jgi:hypothetical protein
MPNARKAELYLAISVRFGEDFIADLKNVRSLGASKTSARETGNNFPNHEENKHGRHPNERNPTR